MASGLPIESIRKRADFLALRQGAKTGTPSFLMVTGPSPVGDSSAPPAARVGITITKKLGGAVRRNRIRRRFREGIRQVFPDYARAGCDYILIAGPAAETRNWPALLDDMKRALLCLSPDTK